MNARRLCMILGALPTAALATPVDERIDAAPQGVVEIHSISGDVAVTGWDDDVVQVSGEIPDSAERLEVRREGDRVFVKVIYPEDGNGTIVAVDEALLIVNVPRASSLRVDTVSAGTSVAGVEGEQQIKSVSGNIILETVAADARVESISGNIQVTGGDSATRITASAVSGDIALDGINGEISLGSVSGEVALLEGRIDRGEITSISGDVTFRGALGENARIQANSTSGDVEFIVVGDAAGEYNLASHTGDIENCFGPAAVSPARGPGSSLQFTEGSGAAIVEISTMSGDVNLCR